jgi:hypothetical protein
MRRLLPAVIRISLITIFQFRTFEMIVRSRTRKKAAMGTRAIGKKSLLREALQNRIKFSESLLMHCFWGAPAVANC